MGLNGHLKNVCVCMCVCSFMHGCAFEHSCECTWVVSVYIYIYI